AALSGPARLSSSGRMDGAEGERCIVVKTAAPRFPGKPLAISRSASTPPADVPITMILGTCSSSALACAREASAIGVVTATSRGFQTLLKNLHQVHNLRGGPGLCLRCLRPCPARFLFSYELQ